MLKLWRNGARAVSGAGRGRYTGHRMKRRGSSGSSVSPTRGQTFFVKKQKSTRYYYNVVHDVCVVVIRVYFLKTAAASLYKNFLKRYKRRTRRLASDWGEKNEKFTMMKNPGDYVDASGAGSRCSRELLFDIRKQGVIFELSRIEKPILSEHCNVLVHFS